MFFKNYHLVFLSIVLIYVFQSCENSVPKVHVVSPAFKVNSPASHGVHKMLESIDSNGAEVFNVQNVNEEGTDYYIFVGLAHSENLTTELLHEMQVDLPAEKEALLIKKTTYRNKPALILCGANEVGLMYACLDVAQRISWSKNQKDLFKYVNDIKEAPDVKERCVSAGTFQRAYFEQKLHDISYWESYFDMMAQNRLNQFLLIFGYKNNQMREPNFMAPAYPNFFSVEEYPFVKLSNVSPEQQQKNTQALKNMIDLAHSRGIEFGVGLWDQIERTQHYKNMVKIDRDIPADFPPNIIWGLHHENLIPYTKLAIRQFFHTFPEIDLVQFRMHWEAGISGDEALKFWKEIFNILKGECPHLKVEARAKDVPDETHMDGVETGMDYRVATKHWMEQMGLPFHPTHINKDNQFDRRHGYAEMLRYPKEYGFKWRVWSGGTTRAMLWGDPEWVKQFAEGSHLYNAVGYEFNEPLYFKMNGSKHDAEVTNLLNPEMKYYNYEFERYWHYYQVMGRIGYNPETPSDIWEMEFNKRFGKETGKALMDGIHQASKVLPRIVAASYLYPRFASPQGWPELQRMEDLKHFALKSKPSDIQQFASVNEGADYILNGRFTVKRTPAQISDWFANTSKSILTKVEKAEGMIGQNPSKEFTSTVTDLKMLAHLSGYHSQRLLAAVQYNLYHKTGDLVSFNRAIDYETKAVEAYGNIVKSASDVYNMKLDFGSNKDLFPGHWKEEHQRLKKELEGYKKERDLLLETIPAKSLMVHIPIQKVALNQPIQISATLHSADKNKSARVLFGFNKNDFKSVDMKISSSGIGTAEIPAIKKEGILKYYIEISSVSGRKQLLSEKSKPSIVIVNNDNEAPIVGVERIKEAPLNKPLNVSASVKDDSDLKEINLRYRRVSQFEDYRSAKMELNAESGKYEAKIPSEYFDGKYDVMYFVEAMDIHGNGAMYPDLEQETPYVMVHLIR